jgi:acid stress chaperone HdeB
MKAVRALAVAFALLGSAPMAQAQVIDLSKTTCKEFLESGKEGIIIIWSWLYGYYSDQDADPVVDFGKLTAQGTKLADYCKAHPDVDVIRAAAPIYE